MKSHISILIILCFSFFSYAQEIDCYNGRYKEKVFSDIDIEFESNTIYATKLTSGGVLQDLPYDVYMPKDDTLDSRPVFMLAHGGGFIDLLDQKSPDIVKLAREMTALGYVVFSVEYREEPNLTSLLSEEKMVKAVGRGLIDIRDATCYIMDTTLYHGNPYRIDPSKVIIGGVSAGAVSFLHAVFLDSLEQMPPQYQDWILEIEPNTNELLADKYCGANILGLVNISGAILDTTWINPDKVDEYPAMMHVHGTQDPIVPYGNARPFGLQNLPRLMGSKLIHRYATRLGIRSELDTYRGQGHVPIIGVNWNALFNGEGDEFLFNPSIMSRTVEHMTEFSYSLIDCNEKVISSIRNEYLGELTIYPNPSRGELRIELPIQLIKAMELSVVDYTGKLLMSTILDPGSTFFKFDTALSSGVYQVILKGESGIYTAKLLVQ